MACVMMNEPVSMEAHQPWNGVEWPIFGKKQQFVVAAAASAHGYQMVFQGPMPFEDQHPTGT